MYFRDPLLPDRVSFLPFCSQTGVFKLRKMLPDRVKITAPQRHTPVHIRTKCPPGFTCTRRQFALFAEGKVCGFVMSVCFELLNEKFLLSAIANCFKL